MSKRLSPVLDRLEEAKRRYGEGCGALVEKLLRSLRGTVRRQRVAAPLSRHAALPAGVSSESAGGEGGGSDAREPIKLHHEPMRADAHASEVMRMMRTHRDALMRLVRTHQDSLMRLMRLIRAGTVCGALSDR